MNIEVPTLPDPGEGYAMVVMRYKDKELAFCIKPEEMDTTLVQSVEALRKLVLDQS